MHIPYLHWQTFFQTATFLTSSRKTLKDSPRCKWHVIKLLVGHEAVHKAYLRTQTFVLCKVDKKQTPHQLNATEGLMRSALPHTGSQTIQCTFIINLMLNYLSVISSEGEIVCIRKVFTSLKITSLRRIKYNVEPKKIHSCLSKRTYINTYMPSIGQTKIWLNCWA